MKKINLFNSAKTMTLALMAMMAAVTVSCTKDQLPDRSPEDKPDTDQTVRLDANVKVNALQDYQKTYAVDALIKFYQGKVGTTGLVTYIKVDGEISITFKTEKANDTAFKQALKNVSANEVDSVLMGTDATSVDISVTEGNEAVIKYSYTAKPAEGTWKGTSGGVNYTFEFTATSKGNGFYAASLTIDGENVEGTVYKSGKAYIFQSTEKDSLGFSKYLGRLVPTDTTMNRMSVVLKKDSNTYLLNEIIFTR